MKLEICEQIASDLIKLLQPYCLRCKVAGSVRRKKPEPNDIEIICIRDENKII